MHIDPLERKWLYVVGGVTAVFLIVIIFSYIFLHVAPPGQMETINSAELHLQGEFAENQLGVKTLPDGSIHATVVAARYGFYPRHITVPAGVPVTFRIASADVLHGIHIPMTNMGTMVVPGYISTETTTFPKPGEYPMLCNEYCGLGHDHMWSRVTVVSQETWAATAPKTGR